jgi:hypothetical protein
MNQMGNKEIVDNIVKNARRESYSSARSMGDSDD